MRLLDPRTIRAKLEDLGIEPKLFQIINNEILKPNGLILVTGPTGSGKTTTLYAFLRRIYSAEIKIITIEDPIEYHLTGITQTQVDPKKGYTFLEGLRSALRQDPDVIMVGEIRDAETAKISVESSLTGHIVFSTLHTNNAAGVIPRLIDLEVNPKILVSALSLAIAQRLVRKLCSSCKKEKTPTEWEENIIRSILRAAKEAGKDLTLYGVNPDQKIKLYEPGTCAECNFIGYKGRIGIFEAIKSDESIEKIINENPSEREIKKVASKQGILDMKEDGVIKALSGITSLDEVKSVVDLEEK
jgi:type II secretory ATPase GspE/PulE/Tfp pilus assembly ATPase PilB-like protein